MAYDPLHLNLFMAAYSGAMSGMGVFGRAITSRQALSYSGLATVAGAFAMAMDMTWGSADVSDLNAATIEDFSEGYWEARWPSQKGLFLTPAQYLTDCSVIISAAQAASNYFNANGIPQNLPTPPGTDGETVLTTNFTFSSFFPIVIASLPAGTVFNRASVLIQTPFNGPASFELGTLANPTLILGPGDVNAEVAGTYTSDAAFTFATATTLVMSVITAATAGSGVLITKFK